MALKSKKLRPRMTLVNLWHSVDSREWEYAEGDLYDSAVKKDNRDVERELERPGLRERIVNMNTQQFYDFLRNEYFKWKFTSAPQ